MLAFKQNKKHKMKNILYSPDATGGALEVDPMTQAAGPIKTDFPLLQPERSYRMIIRSPEIKTSSKGNPMLEFKLVTTEDSVSTEGTKLHSGFGFTKRIMLTPSEGKTMEDVATQLREVLYAVNGPKNTVTPRQLTDNPSIIDNKPVDGTVKIRAAKGEYAASNDMKFTIPKA